MLDELVKSRFSLPWREGIKGRGEITFRNSVPYHPHPNPPPSMGRRFRTFYEIIMLVSCWFISEEVLKKSTIVDASQWLPIVNASAPASFLY